jgi:hypothetical protein
VTTETVDLHDDDHVAEASFRPPSRHWYRLSAVAVLLGVIGAVVWVDHAVGTQKRLVGAFIDLPALDVAGGLPVEIATAGEHTVWAGSTCAGFCRPAGASTYQDQFSLEVTGPADAEATPFAGHHYFNLGADGEGRAVWTVHFAEPGTYQVRLVEEGGLSAPRLWVGSGHGLPVRVLRGAATIGGTALTLALALVVVTFARRRRFYATFAARQRTRAGEAGRSGEPDVEKLYDSVDRWEEDADAGDRPGGAVDDETFDSNLEVLTKRLARPDTGAGPRVPPVTRTTPAPPPADEAGTAAAPAPDQPQPATAVTPRRKAADEALDSQLGALTKRLGRGPVPALAAPPVAAPAAAGPAPADTAGRPETTETTGEKARPEPAPADDAFDSTLGVLTKRLGRVNAGTGAPAVGPPGGASPAPVPAATAPAPTTGGDPGRPEEAERLDSTLDVLTRQLNRRPGTPATASAGGGDLGGPVEQRQDRVGVARRKPDDGLLDAEVGVAPQRLRIRTDTEDT